LGIILKWVFKKWDGAHDVAQVRDRWQDLVNLVVNLKLHKMWEIS
jgi:hypothetical protein